MAPEAIRGEDATVVVADGRIKEVEGAATKAPAGRVIDLKGKTLMPGLIDAPRPRRKYRDPEPPHRPASAGRLCPETCRNLETDLDLGFTHAARCRRAGSGIRAAVDQGLVRGPRLLLSVHAAGAIGREQFDVRAGPRPADGAERAWRLSGESATERIRSGPRRGGPWAAARIRSRCSPTARCCPPRRPTGPSRGQSKFCVEELKAAVDVAEAAGTYVMAHVYAPRPSGTPSWPGSDRSNTGT